MPIYGIEWIVVAVIVVVLLFWGPEKLPKIARSIGQAKKEFEKASKGEEEKQQSIQALTSDDKLLEIAKSLGIQTEGKTRDQIAQEVLNRAQQQRQEGQQ